MAGDVLDCGRTLLDVMRQCLKLRTLVPFTPGVRADEVLNGPTFASRHARTRRLPYISKQTDSVAAG